MKNKFLCEYIVQEICKGFNIMYSAYELYATHTEDLATRFKTTFSRENVQVHFVGVW